MPDVSWPDVALALAAAPAVCAALYLLLLTVAAFLHPGRRRIDGAFAGPREARTRFLLLIPAHDEELLLGEVLDRLRGLSYPGSHFEIAVIADNCTDATAGVARRHGAAVLERTDPDHRGKGQALHWAMQGPLRTWSRPWDALVILDADSCVNADFLWFMDEALRGSGAPEALQAYYGVQNPLESWRTSLLTASLAAFHFLRPLGRDRLGLPCGLKGNGMCFARGLVERFGYPASSVVEDVELALFYLRQGIRVRFVPGAHALGQMAVSGRAATTQRQRWEGGRLALLRAHLGPLLRRGLAARDGACLDAALDLLLPPFTLLLVGTALPAAAAVAARLLAPGAVGLLGPALWCGALAAEAAYVLAALVLARAPSAIWVRLLAAPLFVAWKLGVYLRMALAPRGDEWVRTERQAMRKK